MVLAREPPVSLLDVFWLSVALDTQCLVVILFRHNDGQSLIAD
jgi:hypothetical protein